jgi:hypothetical protein
VAPSPPVRSADRVRGVKALERLLKSAPAASAGTPPALAPGLVKLSPGVRSAWDAALREMQSARLDARAHTAPGGAAKLRAAAPQGSDSAGKKPARARRAAKGAGAAGAAGAHGTPRSAGRAAIDSPQSTGRAPLTPGSAGSRSGLPSHSPAVPRAPVRPLPPPCHRALPPRPRPPTLHPSGGAGGLRRRAGRGQDAQLAALAAGSGFSRRIFSPTTSAKAFLESRAERVRPRPAPAARAAALAVLRRAGGLPQVRAVREAAESAAAGTPRGAAGSLVSSLSSSGGRRGALRAAQAAAAEEEAEAERERREEALRARREALGQRAWRDPPPRVSPAAMAALSPAPAVPRKARSAEASLARWVKRWEAKVAADPDCTVREEGAGGGADGGSESGRHSSRHEVQQGLRQAEEHAAAATAAARSQARAAFRAVASQVRARASQLEPYLSPPKQARRSGPPPDQANDSNGSSAGAPPGDGTVPPRSQLAWGETTPAERHIRRTRAAHAAPASPPRAAPAPGAELSPELRAAGAAAAARRGVKPRTGADGESPAGGGRGKGAGPGGLPAGALKLNLAPVLGLATRGGEREARDRLDAHLRATLSARTPGPWSHLTAHAAADAPAQGSVSHRPAGASPTLAAGIPVFGAVGSPAGPASNGSEGRPSPKKSKVRPVLGAI